MTCSVKTPLKRAILPYGYLLRGEVWVNVYDTVCHGHPKTSRLDAKLMADTHRPPLYRIKVTPKVRP